MTFKDASIIFDLDGTLVDTAPDLLAALNHVLQSIDCPEVTLNDIDKLVGDGAMAMIKTGLNIAERDLPQEQEEELLQKFLDYYYENIAIFSKPFEGLDRCLDHFLREDARVGICTNKKEHLSIKLINELGLSERFHTIVGADTLAVKKPHPDHILGTIERLQGNPEKAVMIGDSANDIKAAQAANIPVIAVTFGYTAQPVTDFSPDIVIDHYDELLPAVEKLL